MSMALLRATQVRITVSVQVTTDREAEWLKVLFFLLTPIWVLWQLNQRTKQFWLKWKFRVVQVKELLTFITTVLTITFTAFAYGLGVRR